MKKFCLVIFLLGAGFVVGYNMPMWINVSIYKGPNMDLARNVEVLVGRSHDYTFGFYDGMIRIECRKK